MANKLFFLFTFSIFSVCAGVFSLVCGQKVLATPPRRPEKCLSIGLEKIERAPFKIYEAELLRKVDNLQDLKDSMIKIKILRQELCSRLSNKQLKQWVQRSMNREIESRKYLPGGSPNSEVMHTNQVEDLISEYLQKNGTGSALKNLTANIESADNLYIQRVELGRAEFGKLLEGFEAWRKRALEVELFRELEKRTKSGIVNLAD